MAEGTSRTPIILSNKVKNVAVTSWNRPSSLVVERPFYDFCLNVDSFSREHFVFAFENVITDLPQEDRTNQIAPNDDLPHPIVSSDLRSIIQRRSLEVLATKVKDTSVQRRAVFENQAPAGSFCFSWSSALRVLEKHISYPW